MRFNHLASRVLPYKETKCVIDIYVMNKVVCLPDYSLINRWIGKLDVQVHRLVLALQQYLSVILNRISW
jgi:hypothetical protein